MLSSLLKQYGKHKVVSLEVSQQKQERPRYKYLVFTLPAFRPHFPPPDHLTLLWDRRIVRPHHQLKYLTCYACDQDSRPLPRPSLCSGQGDTV